jgi:hypothetical protein
MNAMSARTQPRGQVLVIAAGAMVVLIAIGAIVMDLGMSWMLHRQEQNAADPGALAAAQWVPSGNMGMANQEACFYAQQNGFFVGDAGCAAAFAAGDLDVNSPPVSDMSGNFRGRPGFVEVIIRDTHPSFFGQFFGQPTALVTTAAVASLTNGNSNSSSLVALGEQCTPPDDGDSTVTGGGTLTIHPATGVTVPGGFVNVNAGCGAIRNPGVCDGNGNASALAITGNSTLISPHFFVTGACGTGGGGQIQCYGASPCLDEQAIPIGDPLENLPEPWPYLQGSLPVPDCPKVTEVNSPTDNNPCNLTRQNCPQVGTIWICTMNPGVYYAGWDIGNNVRVDMKPGMYVFAGGGIRLNAGASLESVTGVDGGGNPVDARVTIFSTDGPTCTPTAQTGQCEGAITLQSNGQVQLKATDDVTCTQVSPAICPWKGILLWQDGTVSRQVRDVSITAQSDLILAGTIYAPESNVSIAGGTNGTGCSGSPQTCLAIQIIARQWSIAGGGVIDMPYDPDELYQLEQRGLVY